MKAIEIRSFVSDWLELAITDLHPINPDKERYLVKIHAWGVIFFDMLNSKTFNVGDRVVGSCHGAYATHILVPPENIFHIPSDWSFRDAAGLYVSVPPAYAGLVTRGKIESGEWALIHAGARVIATAGGTRKCKIYHDYGADYVINYREKDWTKQIINLCEQHREGNGRKGVDVLFDPVRSGSDRSVVQICRVGCRLVVVGFAGGAIEKIAMNRVLLKNVSIVGLHWGPYEQYEPQMVPVFWNEVNRLIASQKIRGISFSDREFWDLKSIRMLV
ncbi:NADPH2:quinone reductase [Penicillium lividum]|nr:NADPH2:quinone reductase [Penicillium lividum]